MKQTLKPVRLQPRRWTESWNIRAGRHGIFFLIVLWYCFPSHARSEASDATSGGNVGHLAQIVHDLCERLHLNDHVEVRIDESNAKMVSSEPLPGSTSGYRISFDRQFLENLNDDEIVAAIAHELGHVWIFTHHPYLQTEALANDIALRVVDRETMKKVYSKLWAHTGTSGNIDELLGPSRTPEPPKAATVLP
jgi:peptidase M48-like protein